MKQLSGLRGRFGVAVALIGVLVLGMTASPMAAATTLINCVGESELHYSPGLTNEVQTVTFSGEDRAITCLSLTHPTLHSFIGPYGGTGEQACTSLDSDGEGTQTLYWNGTTNLTSFWEFTYSASTWAVSSFPRSRAPLPPESLPARH
jgi:hypothetical protein